MLFGLSFSKYYTSLASLPFSHFPITESESTTCLCFVDCDWCGWGGSRATANGQKIKTSHLSFRKWKKSKKKIPDFIAGSQLVACFAILSLLESIQKLLRVVMCVKSSKICLKFEDFLFNFMSFFALLGPSSWVDYKIVGSSTAAWWQSTRDVLFGCFQII